MAEPPPQTAGKPNRKLSPRKIVALLLAVPAVLAIAAVLVVNSAGARRQTQMERQVRELHDEVLSRAPRARPRRRRPRKRLDGLRQRARRLRRFADERS